MIFVEKMSIFLAKKWISHHSKVALNHLQFKKIRLKKGGKINVKKHLKIPIEEQKINEKFSPSHFPVYEIEKLENGEYNRLNLLEKYFRAVSMYVEENEKYCCSYDIFKYFLKMQTGFNESFDGLSDGDKAYFFLQQRECVKKIEADVSAFVGENKKLLNQLYITLMEQLPNVNKSGSTNSEDNLQENFRPEKFFAFVEENWEILKNSHCLYSALMELAFIENKLSNKQDEETDRKELGKLLREATKNWD
jgi:cell division protein FtsB